MLPSGEPIHHHLDSNSHHVSKSCLDPNKPRTQRKERIERLQPNPIPLSVCLKDWNFNSGNDRHGGHNDKREGNNDKQGGFNLA